MNRKMAYLIMLNVIFASLHSMAKKELAHNIARLDKVSFKKIDLKLPLADCPDKTYMACNPSIVLTPTGYIVLCRTLNYSIFMNSDNVYTSQMICNEQFTKTKNVAVFYDKNFNKIKQAQLTEYQPKHYFRHIGPEDCRIFQWDGEYWFSGTLHDCPTEKGMCRIALAHLKNLNDPVIDYDQLAILPGIETNRHEKNWLPFVRHNKLFMVYSYDPFTILEVEKNGQHKVVSKQEVPYDLSKLRGSAAPIPFKGGYLLMVHDIVPPRVAFMMPYMKYYHRFIYMDNNFKIKKISNFFTFRGQTIEYVCGMTLDHSNKKLVMGLGVWDREAYLAFVDADYVWSLLKDL